jgi:hypothetical protein
MSSAVLAEHDATGAALTMRGVQGARPLLFDLGPTLTAMTAPTLMIAGMTTMTCWTPTSSSWSSSSTLRSTPVAW